MSVYEGIDDQLIESYRASNSAVVSAKVELYGAARALASAMVRRDFPTADKVWLSVEVDHSDIRGTPILTVNRIEDTAGELLLDWRNEAWFGGVRALTREESELEERLADAPWEDIYEQEFADAVGWPDEMFVELEAP